MLFFLRFDFVLFWASVAYSYKTAGNKIAIGKRRIAWWVAARNMKVAKRGALIYEGRSY